MAAEDVLFNSPIPGQSLTKDPDMRSPWENPPKFTTPEQAMLHFREVTTSPNFIRNLAELVSAERLDDKPFYLDRITSGMLQEGFLKGLYTVDTMVLLAEPLLAMLVWATAQLNELPRFSTDTGYEDRTGFEQMAMLEEEANTMVPSSEGRPQSPLVTPQGEL